MLPKQWADTISIKFYGNYNEFTHGCWHILLMCMSKVAPSVDPGRSSATGRHSTTKSTAGRVKRTRRNVSRRARLMRLRTQARLAHLREMASPRRAMLWVLGAANMVSARSLTLQL